MFPKHLSDELKRAAHNPRKLEKVLLRLEAVGIIRPRTDVRPGYKSIAGEARAAARSA